jgi:hypothetical protein
VLTSSLNVEAVKAETVETGYCSVNLSPCDSSARNVAQSQNNFVVGVYDTRPANLSSGTGTLEEESLAPLKEFCRQTGATNVIPKSCNAPTARKDSVSPIPLHKRESGGDRLALSTLSGVDPVQATDLLAQIPQAPQLPSDIELPTDVQEQELPS